MDNDKDMVPEKQIEQNNGLFVCAFLLVIICGGIACLAEA